MEAKTIVNTNPYPNTTATVKINGREIKVHAVSTGTVAVKRNFMTCKGGLLSKANIVLDRHYTEWLPIWVWIIEHPEGTIMIDTGEIDVVNSSDHLSRENAISRFINSSICKFQIEAQDNLDRKLAEVGMKTEDIKLVAFTHLHLDHTDGIRFFPKAEFIVNEYEYKHPYSNLPSTYPSWFKPRTVNYSKDMVEVFDKAYAITRDHRVLYVPTPGHTHGHSSIILKTDDHDIIFAGDTSYIQAQVLSGELAGANISYAESRDTYAKLIKYATTHKSIYLPSHDPEAAHRMVEKHYLI